MVTLNVEINDPIDNLFFFVFIYFSKQSEWIQFLLQSEVDENSFFVY